MPTIQYRILVQETRDIKGGTEIPATIPMSFTADKSNIFLGEIFEFKDLEFGKRLSNYGRCSFKIPVHQTKLADLIQLRKNTIWIYRVSGENSTLVWSGEQVALEGHLNPEENNWATLYCFDWFYLLKDRYTADYVRYDGVDGGDMAWRLINTTQSKSNGNFGIKRGTIEVTQDRDRSYYNQNIMEAIVNLSNVVGGFDFEIDNNRNFNVYSIKGQDKSEDVILEYGKNITNVTIEQDAVNMANNAIILGESEDVDELQRIDRKDSAKEVTYKIREGLMNESEISDTTTLEDRGDALLSKYSEPLIKLDFDLSYNSVSITDFSLGDLVRIIIKSGIYDIEEQYRVFEWTIFYDEKNTERLSLVLGRLGI